MAWNFASHLQRYGPTAPRRTISPTLAWSYCAGVARAHYENFSVLSVVVPRALLPHFANMYAYCRWADDLADEHAAADNALSLLAWWRTELHAVYDGTPTHPVMIALCDTVRKFGIPREPFLNLVTAFEQDQRQKHYDTFDELLAYCTNSANPVGRLVLYLYECHTPARAELSDQICTGLQLANFWQDVRRDFDTLGRVYLPREDCVRFGYTPGTAATQEYRNLIQFEVKRTAEYFERGRALLNMLPARPRANIELFFGGGLATLRAIEDANYDTWTTRPTVSKRAKVGLILRALPRLITASRW